MKNISILGATGSIGRNTLDLIQRESDQLKVVGLTGANNIRLLAECAIKFNADIVATSNDNKFHDLKEMLSGHQVEVCAGINGVLEVASRQVDWVMSSIVGSAGLLPGLKALEAGANLALANKESMVAAGPIMKRVAEAHGVKLIPVDSEHSVRTSGSSDWAWQGLASATFRVRLRLAGLSPGMSSAVIPLWRGHRCP